MNRRFAIASVLAASAVLGVRPAHADPNDISLNRLSFYNNNQTGIGAPQFVYSGGCGSEATMGASCRPDNQLFFNLVNQLGGALAPSLMAPAATIGYGGLYLGYEHSISNINGDGDYWRRGTVGTDRDLQMGGGTAVRRERVPNQLFVSRLHVRKGFAYGFELGLQTSYLHESGLFALGLDIRWAPFEGYRRGVGWLPDFAIRGSVNTLIANPQLYLTVVGIDATISKQFNLGGLSTLTPYLGGQAMMIFGDSTVIDGTPLRSSYAECPRRAVNFIRDDAGRIISSELQCTGGTPYMGFPNDSGNEMVFQPARLLRWRAFGGLRYRFGIFTATAEFAMDVLTRPSYLGDPPRGAGRPNAAGVPQDIVFDEFRQFMVSFGLGVTFN